MNLPAGGGALSYQKLKDDTYLDFQFPRADIRLGGKEIKDKSGPVLADDINVELTSGYEAALATFRLYNVYDAEAGRFRFDGIRKQVALGNALEIKLGYKDQLKTVFTGFVAGVSFGYEPGDAVYVEVTGMDVKGVMMSGSYALQLTAKSYGEAVREILEKTAYERLVSAEAVTELVIDKTPDKKEGGNDGESAETLEMVNESDYEFVVKAAKKFGYEFFTECGRVYFRKPKSNTGTLIALGVKSGLTRFDVGYSLTGMVETVEVRSMDPGTGKVITGRQKYTGELSWDSKAKKLIQGSRYVYTDPSVFTQEHADARAASLYEAMRYRLGSLRCECVGIPDIQPGRFIDITGMGPPADNRFYLTAVNHVLSSERGYFTRLTGCSGAVKP